MTVELALRQKLAAAGSPYFMPPGETYIVGFSGGRSSGMLLYEIVAAHGGCLPDYIHVVFDNTSKERQEALDFIQRCSVEFGVRIVWLQYKWDATPENRWEEVSHNSAARNGEVFRELVERETSALPNPAMRLCTGRLKLRTTYRWAAAQGITSFTSVIGYRADETRRVRRAAARIGKECKAEEDAIFPLHAAGVTKKHVAAFWENMPFDLSLPNINGSTPHGNCDLCFLKGTKTLLSLIKEEPQRADWWIEMESLGLASKPTGNLFRIDRPNYARLKEIALSQSDFSAIADDFDARPCGCHD